MIRRPLRFVAILAGLACGLAAPGLRAQDASNVVVRLSQLEEQMRQMSGRLEELEFQNKQLRDQLKRFQEDTEYRFQEGKGAGPAGAGSAGAGLAPSPRAPAAATPAAPTAPPRQIAIGAPSAPLPAPAPPRAAARGDVFDPDAEPGAPGSPRPLGSPESPAPAPRRVAVPGSIMEDPDGAPRGAGTPLDLGGSGGASPQAPPRPPQSSIASTGTDSIKADYDNAYAFIQQRQFEQAEMGFRSFLQSHPRSKLVSDATYWLGESYLQRARYRDAAEQFLKITTSYGTSSKGPDGMFKLGVSLRGLGANDQACATFAELGRKYPAARPALMKEVQREQQRSKCPS